MRELQSKSATNVTKPNHLNDGSPRCSTPVNIFTSPSVEAPRRFLSPKPCTISSPAVTCSTPTKATNPTDSLPKAKAPRTPVPANPVRNISEIDVPPLMVDGEEKVTSAKIKITMVKPNATARTLTNDLLGSCFTKDELKNHSLKGGTANSYKGQARPALPSNIVNAIEAYVSERYPDIGKTSTRWFETFGNEKLSNARKGTKKPKDAAGEDKEKDGGKE